MCCDRADGAAWKRSCSCSFNQSVELHVDDVVPDAACGAHNEGAEEKEWKLDEKRMLC